MVSGHGVYNGVGGTVEVTTLRTGEIHVESGIVPLTFDLISGGVFVVTGATIKDVINAGEVISYGDNQPVLDNWGSVTTWLVEKPITARGLSGVGFVHFGDLDLLDVRAPITTLGVGGRGFNLYDGTIRRAVFDSITTHGDGGVGIVVSKDLAELEVRGDLTTLGGEGHSLYRGMQIPLKATALDVKSGGTIGSVTVGGSIITKGAGITAVSVEGTIGSLHVKSGIHAEGQNADAVHLVHDIPGLAETAVSALDGEDVVWLQV